MDYGAMAPWGDNYSYLHHRGNVANNKVGLVVEGMKEGEFYPYDPACFTPKSVGFKGYCSNCPNGIAEWMRFHRRGLDRIFRAYCNICKERLAEKEL
jgi:hypothetical protein